MKRALIFPGGAGGNHVRWLMYLDSSIHPEKSIQQKMDFILNEVYSNLRSFYNWLPWEAQWRYKDEYESFIQILHEPKDDVAENKTIFLSFDNYELPLYHYSVLTSCFTSETSYNQYYNFLKSFDRKIPSKLKENKLVLKSDVLFEKELDKDFYQSVIKWYELENHYNEACIVHDKWYKTRKRVEKESLEFYTGPFWQSFLSRLTHDTEPARIDVYRNKGLLP